MNSNNLGKLLKRRSKKKLREELKLLKTNSTTLSQDTRNSFNKLTHNTKSENLHGKELLSNSSTTTPAGKSASPCVSQTSTTDSKTLKALIKLVWWPLAIVPPDILTTPLNQNCSRKIF